MTTLEKPDLLNDEPKAHPGRKLTEKQFMAWVDDFTRAEWVNGEVIIMAPANYRHIRIQNWLIAVLLAYVDHHGLGETGGSEYLIRLNKGRTLRMPDIFFVAARRKKILMPTYMNGAPDAAFEIVSPDSKTRDWQDKYEEYAAAGIREYWIIDPAKHVIDAYVLKNREYQRLPDHNGKIASAVIKGFYLKPEWFWQPSLPSTLDIAREFRLLG